MSLTQAHQKRASTSESTLETQDPSSQVFTIGKVDAGIAVLISDSVHLIEFPSLLLPAGVGPGSIVNISCTRNTAAERATSKAFWDLQNDIFTTFGEQDPKPPTLRIRNTTQTSVTLEWDKLELAQAKLLGLSIWRNKERLTSIPNPLTNTSTKLSGLSLNTDYTFHLVLKTSAGTYSSEIVKTRTHTIEDTSGVAVCFGLVEPEGLLAEAKKALQEMKGKGAEKIQIETTHFVATSPASVENPSGGPSVEYQKAVQLSIPVLSPNWLIACAREKKMVPISTYYSIGPTNHAASLSSANLASSTNVIPKTLPRHATNTTTTVIEEEPTFTPAASAAAQPPHSVPAVAPAPAHAPKSELAEEEPDAPPASDFVSQVRETVGSAVTATVEKAKEIVSPPVKEDVEETKTKEEKEEEVRPMHPPTPTIEFHPPEEDLVQPEEPKEEAPESVVPVAAVEPESPVEPIEPETPADATFEAAATIKPVEPASESEGSASTAVAAPEIQVEDVDEKDMQGTQAITEVDKDKASHNESMDDVAL